MAKAFESYFIWLHMLYLCLLTTIDEVQDNQVMAKYLWLLKAW